MKATAKQIPMMKIHLVERDPGNSHRELHHLNQVIPFIYLPSCMYINTSSTSGLSMQKSNFSSQQLYFTGFQNLVRSGSKKLRNSLRRHSIHRKEEQTTHTSVSSCSNLIPTVSAWMYYKEFSFSIPTTLQQPCWH